jgi:hypothetical protein
MRLKELQSALAEIRDVFAAGGSSTAERDLDAVLSLLASEPDRDLGAYLAEIRNVLNGKRHPSSSASELAATLIAAGLDEEKFKTALATISADQAIGKQEMLDLAKTYGVIRLNARSRSTILESIEKHFYWMLINRDADNMAKRATPW